MHDVDVAVVGYGPTGALAALLLGRAGVSCAVLDHRCDIYPLPRAVAADDEVLRILVDAGLSGAVNAMLPAAGARFVDRRGRALLDVALSAADAGVPPLALYRQPDLEAALRVEVAKQPDVRVHLGEAHRVTGLRRDRDGVDLLLADGTTLRARYVVACDGASSRLRQLVDVGFPSTGADQRWLVVDAVGTEPPNPGDVWVTYHCDPAQPAVVMPTPNGMRVELLLTDPDGPIGPMDIDAAAALVGAHLEAGGPDARVERATVYRFGSRVATSWRSGRVLLAGDAAHTMPPFAGQGLAAGIRDVANVTWKLALVLREQASPELLDSYEAERRPHLRQMTRLTRLMGALVTLTHPVASSVRDHGLRLVGQAPIVGAWLRSGGPRPGSRKLASPLVLQPDGGRIRLDRLQGPGFGLVGAQVHPYAALHPCLHGFWDRLGTQPVAIRDGELPDLPVGHIAIVRPDHVVVDVVPAARLSEATNAYRRHLQAGPAEHAVTGSRR